MLKNFLLLGMTALFAAGCGVRAETYVMNKERVGITSTGGNAGYLTGTPQFQAPQKKTRKIYILEVSKPLPEGEVKKIQQEISTTTHETSMVEIPQEEAAVSFQQPSAIVIPRIDDEPAAAPSAAENMGPTEAVAYTVLKDDTLQKISKKFYGSYSKWYKIYEANKDKLQDPNSVRPGTVITIPAVQ